jgi:hypothetical protein
MTQKEVVVAQQHNDSMLTKVNSQGATAFQDALRNDKAGGNGSQDARPRWAEEVRCSMTLEERLEKIEAMLVVLVERQQVREYYSVEEFSRIVGRAEFTCREWCRHGRIKAEKKESGRGAYASWAIPHAELLRFQKEGLLPPRK